MGRYCMARSITWVSPPLITTPSRNLGNSRTAAMASRAKSRHTLADTAATVRMRFSSRLPQYWLMSTMAPVDRPPRAAVTKVVMALLWATADRAFWPVRVTITLSAITTSRFTAL